MVLAFLLVFFGIRSIATTQRRPITFTVALSSHLHHLISCVFYVYWEIIYFNFMHDFMDKYAAYRSPATGSGASAAAVQAQIQQMNKLKVLYKTALQLRNDVPRALPVASSSPSSPRRSCAGSRNRNRAVVLAGYILNRLPRRQPPCQNTAVVPRSKRKPLNSSERLSLHSIIDLPLPRLLRLALPAPAGQPALIV